jgi:hypothetical protein
LCGTYGTLAMLDFDPLYSTSQIEAIERFIDKHYALGAPGFLPIASTRLE